MNCPHCGHDLSEERYEGIAIDVCGGCGGVWLDEGELEEIVRRREASFSEDEVASVPGAREHVTVGKEEMGEGYPCPKCGARCRRSNYAYTSGVIIDKCPKGEGIWLDEHELEKIQIVVEEWEKKRGEYKEKVGPELDQIKQEVERKTEESFSKMGRARLPLVGRLVNGLVRGIVRVDD